MSPVKIQCERCDRWMELMGPRNATLQELVENIPDPYVCWHCEPRPLPTIGEIQERFAEEIAQRAKYVPGKLRGVE